MAPAAVGGRRRHIQGAGSLQFPAPPATIAATAAAGLRLDAAMTLPAPPETMIAAGYASAAAPAGRSPGGGILCRPPAVAVDDPQRAC